MKGEARDILTPHRCSQCGYDLKGLPRKHLCPECGERYHLREFEIPGWWPARNGVWWFLPISVGLMFTGSIAHGGAFIAVPLVAMPIVLFISATQIRRINRRMQGIPEILLTVTEDKLRIASYEGKLRQAHSWSEFRGVWLSQRSRSRWQLRLERRWPAAATRVPIEVVIPATKREAALIRNEIRRRIAAAAIRK